MNPLRSAILNVVHHSTRFPAIQHAAFGSLSARRLWRLVSTLGPSGLAGQQVSFLWCRPRPAAHQAPLPVAVGVSLMARL